MMSFYFVGLFRHASDNAMFPRRAIVLSLHGHVQEVEVADKPALAKSGLAPLKPVRVREHETVIRNQRRSWYEK